MPTPEGKIEKFKFSPGVILVPFSFGNDLGFVMLGWLVLGCVVGVGLRIGYVEVLLMGFGSPGGGSGQEKSAGVLDGGLAEVCGPLDLMRSSRRAGSWRDGLGLLGFTGNLAEVRGSLDLA